MYDETRLSSWKRTKSSVLRRLLSFIFFSVTGRLFAPFIRRYYDLVITMSAVGRDAFQVRLTLGSRRYYFGCSSFNVMGYEDLTPKGWVNKWRQKGYPDDIARAREKVKALASGTDK